MHTNGLRGSMSLDQERPISDQRQFIGRQSMPGRQSRTSALKLQATPNHKESEKTALTGVELELGAFCVVTGGK